MGFVAPLVLVGLGALAIPVLIHLIQRERKRVVEFPSLMFLRKIPYQSVRRRRIRDWLLLAMRLAALALIVLAFARPFFKRSELAAASQNGAREAIILVDTSYSMESAIAGRRRSPPRPTPSEGSAPAIARRWSSSRPAPKSPSARRPIAAASKPGSPPRRRDPGRPAMPPR
jgi:hypothetical protein